MFGCVKAKDFLKTADGISKENEASFELIAHILQEFEEFELNEGQEASENGEFNSIDFIRSVVTKNYPQRYFNIRHLYKGKSDDVLQKFVAEIDEDNFFSIPTSFGNLNLMFYQQLSIYLAVYGKKSTDIGLHLSLKTEEINPFRTETSRSWNKIIPIAETTMFPSKSSSFTQKPFVLNLPTGTGKTITSILTAAIAMCDIAFQKDMMKEKNSRYWFRDFHNIIPGSDVLIQMSNLESLDVKILPVTIINVQSGSLFSQWYYTISSRLDDIAKYCQESIFRRTGIKRGVKVNLYPTKSDGKLMSKLKSFSNLWSNNQDDSVDYEIAFVITTDSNFLSFVEKDNELFTSQKKRKVEGKVAIVTDTPVKRVIYCPTVFINDEPQTSSIMDKYSRVLAPLNFYLCATIPQVLTENTAFGKILRGNTFHKRVDNLEQNIIGERDLYGYLLSSCLLSYSTLRLSCFEAVTRGKMPKSIIVFDPTATSFYLQLGGQPPIYPNVFHTTNATTKEAIHFKYQMALHKYNTYRLEMDKSEKEFNIRYDCNEDIWIYCVDCLSLVESCRDRNIKFCKKCLACGVCYKCLPLSTTEFVCHFCDLEKVEILKSFLPIIGIDAEYTIPELLIPKDFEILDLNFFNNFYKDIRTASDDIETTFKFTEEQKILIKIERSIVQLKANLLNIFDAKNFAYSFKLYFTMTALAIANFRHLVIILNNAFLDDEKLRFVKLTPFGSKCLLFDGKKSKAINTFSRASRDTFCVLVITVKDIVGIDLQNADAILNLSNSGLLDTNQISGRLMRLGMDYRTRIIINFKISHVNLLSI